MLKIIDRHIIFLCEYNGEGFIASIVVRSRPRISNLFSQNVAFLLCREILDCDPLICITEGSKNYKALKLEYIKTVSGASVFIDISSLSVKDVKNIKSDNFENLICSGAIPNICSYPDMKPLKGGIYDHQ